MKISILTLFPQMFVPVFGESMLKRAQEKGAVSIHLVNIRDFGIGKHKLVDDTPYGGGHGMVLRVDVLEKAIQATKIAILPSQQQKVFLLDARGDIFTQERAIKLSTLQHLILICGHYEGVDERINNFIDGKISVGSFVLTGGEIPAMLVADAVIRLLPGVLKEGVTPNESFSFIDSENNQILLEHPHYTKPPVFKSLAVPQVLLSGDHKKIEEWRASMRTSTQK